ncbi:AAA family ATPase [Vibrio maerlii]|uniref:AAA family ATPase n=1 Tax=Vibrio maerlii TaxID=2231648 RepID=UPI000E3CDCF2
MRSGTSPLLFLCLSLLSFSSLASTAFEDEKVTELHNDAIEISNEVQSLPEPLFMTKSDIKQTKDVLRRTLIALSQHTETFSSNLSQYYSEPRDETWENVESNYLTLNSLSKSKQSLLELTTAATRETLTGFGPIGVTQLKEELYLTQLNAEYLIIFQLRSFKKLISDFFISPIPIVWAGLKVFFIYILLSWWLANSGRLVEGFKKNQIASVQEPPLWVRLIWYISRARIAIAWLIAITLSLNILAELPSLQHLVFLEVFTWWILGGSIAVSFLLEFVYRHSRAAGKDAAKLRLSTIRRFVWSAIVTGVILQLAGMTVGIGTIYYWISSLVVFWYAFITFTVLRMWKATVFESVEAQAEQPNIIRWAYNKRDIFVLGLISTAIAAFWLFGQFVRNLLLSNLSRYTLFSQGLAYLFRIEVAKQSDQGADSQNLVRIKGNKAFEYITPGSEDSELIDYGTEEIKQLGRYLFTDSPAVVVVSGERGIGSTTLLKQLLYKVKNAEPIYLNCPYAGYKELLVHFAVSLGLEEDATEIQILSHLRKSETTYLIAVDNTQRLVKPMVGGLSSLIKFTNLLRRSKKNHRVVMSIEKSSWRFVDRARGERLLFDMVTFLPNWNETQVEALLDSRINRKIENPLTFEGLVVPKQWDQEHISEEQRAKKGFYRILWHYSDGNPTVALRFFRLSLRRNKESDAVVVRLFHAPQSQELEKMPKPMLAVLRSIVQLEIATPDELSECTQLSTAEVLGTLRYFQSRGYIEWSEDKARLSDHWFRHITNVLDRQHLLVK